MTRPVGTARAYTHDMQLMLLRTDDFNNLTPGVVARNIRLQIERAGWVVSSYITFSKTTVEKDAEETHVLSDSNVKPSTHFLGHVPGEFVIQRHISSESVSPLDHTHAYTTEDCSLWLFKGQRALLLWMASIASLDVTIHVEKHFDERYATF